jgi:ANTAR domain
MTMRITRHARPGAAQTPRPSGRRDLRRRPGRGRSGGRGGVSREIGTAMGVLMARNQMTQEEAFEALRGASQHLNRKLRDVAAEVVDTGVLPDLPAPSRRD